MFKGDNNNFLDPTHPGRSELVGKLWVRVPHGGTRPGRVPPPPGRRRGGRRPRRRPAARRGGQAAPASRPPRPCQRHVRPARRRSTRSGSPSSGRDTQRHRSPRRRAGCRTHRRADRRRSAPGAGRRRSRFRRVHHTGPCGRPRGATRRRRPTLAASVTPYAFAAAVGRLGHGRRYVRRTALPPPPANSAGANVTTDAAPTRPVVLPQSTWLTPRARPLPPVGSGLPVVLPQPRPFTPRTITAPVAPPLPIVTEPAPADEPRRAHARAPLSRPAAHPHRRGRRCGAVRAPRALRVRSSDHEAGRGQDAIPRGGQLRLPRSRSAERGARLPGRFALHGRPRVPAPHQPRSGHDGLPAGGGRAAQAFGHDRRGAPADQPERLVARPPARAGDALRGRPRGPGRHARPGPDPQAHAAGRAADGRPGRELLARRRARASTRRAPSPVSRFAPTSRRRRHSSSTRSSCARRRAASRLGRAPSRARAARRTRSACAGTRCRSRPRAGSRSPVWRSLRSPLWSPCCRASAAPPTRTGAPTPATAT